MTKARMEKHKRLRIFVILSGLMKLSLHGQHLKQNRKLNWRDDFRRS